MIRISYSPKEEVVGWCRPGSYTAAPTLLSGRGGKVVGWRELEENTGTWNDQFSELEEEVLGVCWYCGAKLSEGYDRDVVCRERLGEEEE
jgi:hypothetical protein